MKKKLIIIIGIFIVALATLFLVFREQNSDTDSVDYIRGASEGTGFIPEKVIGDPENAKVVVYEYADYGCSHCAEWNRRMNDFIKNHGDSFVLVFRAYDIGFNNGTLASKAATAAQIQGYFKEYKDLLFSNQSEWIYAETSKVQDLFAEYFEAASSGNGDMDKFKSDLTSDAVRKRVNFEQRMGERARIKGTPTFRIDGETIELGKLIETIEQKMAQ